VPAQKPRVPGYALLRRADSPGRREPEKEREGEASAAPSRNHTSFVQQFRIGPYLAFSPSSIFSKPGLAAVIVFSGPYSFTKYCPASFVAMTAPSIR
jgi:hypothetical protein